MKSAAAWGRRWLASQFPAPHPRGPAERRRCRRGHRAWSWGFGPPPTDSLDEPLRRMQFANGRDTREPVRIRSTSQMDGASSFLRRRRSSKCAQYRSPGGASTCSRRSSGRCRSRVHQAAGSGEQGQRSSPPKGRASRRPFSRRPSAKLPAQFGPLGKQSGAACQSARSGA